VSSKDRVLIKSLFSNLTKLGGA